MIYNFECDYAEGALSEVMSALCATNLEQTSGYGEDDHCRRARQFICDCMGRDTEVQFVVGGTQANTIVLTAALRPHEAAVCATSGHINTHETGAPEAAGHKVISFPGIDGKISPRDVQRALDEHMPVHTAKPRMVYISQPTEWGTVYSLDELRALYEFTRAHGMYLFIDGARLGCALGRAGADMTLAHMAGNCDVFTIGGTKCGALFGEAIVINAPEIARDIRYIIKQRGAMLAKGRLLGVQFEPLMANGAELYLRASRHACECAQRLAAGFAARGIAMRYDSPTNQIFPILSDRQCDALHSTASFLIMEKAGDGRNVARFVCSWATSDEAVGALLEAIARI